MNLPVCDMSITAMAFEDQSNTRILAGVTVMSLRTGILSPIACDATTPKAA